MNAHTLKFQVAGDAISREEVDRLPNLLIDLQLIFRFLQNGVPNYRRLDEGTQNVILLGSAAKNPIASYMPTAASRSVEKLVNEVGLFTRLEAEHPLILPGILAYALAVKDRTLLSEDEGRTADIMIAFAEQRGITALPLKPASPRVTVAELFALTS